MVNTMMKKIEWLIWVLRWGTPKNRARNIRHFTTVEAYRLWCWLKGQRIADPFFDEHPLPAGKYIIVQAIPRLSFRLFRWEYCFSQEIPVEYAPYSSELEHQLREQTGKPVRVENISYVFGDGGRA